MVASEGSEQATTEPTPPRTVDILRRQVSAAGDPSSGISPTWSAVAGLSGLTAYVYRPHEWTAREEAQIELREGDRIVVVADVPTAGGIAADTILRTDRVRFDDALFGTTAFEIVEVRPPAGEGLIWLHVRYARED